MAIAPIQGMLKKHLFTHLSIGIGGGLVAASQPAGGGRQAEGLGFLTAFDSSGGDRHTFHVPKTTIRDQWYLDQQKAKESA
ncbi:SPOSA6832_01889 [Sporobolomyces salmonicolor]|uniref:SPOSA6832_01889-mRNA-1:cds n=1 Tax=Sporidiobolus salmonicolor TaxID=5005 RepID=A0A0D6EJY0_SPOSA|nr:SPOSA6832_01889 [Sporobolomyces salmonicolor]